MFNRSSSTMLLGVFFVLVASGCASAARPGEATITGGSASAARVEDGGWVFRTQPVPKETESKPGPWVLILRPLPAEPEKIPDAIKKGESQPQPTESKP